MVACPNCRAPLESQTLEGLYGRPVTIDVCGACQGIWFDDGESLQLGPRGTLDLFRTIADRQGSSRRPLAERLECPRCGLRLSTCTDQQRTTKFRYHRCPRGHGRFITFFHFLRARNFVRNLTPREIAHLRSQVQQVHCSNCAAPLDLEHSVACGYCRAPISMLDPDQIRKALGELEEAEARRQQVDPALPLTLMAERLKSERIFAEAEAAGGRDLRWDPLAGGSASLVEAGVALVQRWLSGSRR